MGKRLFDFVCASVGLVFLAPVLLLVALVIKSTSRGPVFYRGTRVGLGGKPFRIFKFRTMVTDAERLGGPSTPDGDPRVTPVGRFLRRRKLDELPQLLNVIAGDMSFVGPRPEVQQYVQLYTIEEKAILSVRPGITDFATLWNSDEGAALAGATDPEKDYMERIRPKKLKLQLKYVRERSLRTDLWIIWQTAKAVVMKSAPHALATPAAQESTRAEPNH